MTVLGTFLPPFASAEEIAATARDAEALGLESVWATDHLSGRAPMLDPGLVLATAAAGTTTLRLGYGVLLAAIRPLPLLAKQLASLVHLSEGRLLVGVGDGRGAWGRWHGGVRDAPAWRALGVPRDEAAPRTNEALRLLPRLLAGEPVDDLALAPAVATPPLLIGGEPTDEVLRRVADAGAGWFPAVVSPEQVADGVRRLRQLADPAPEVTVALPALLDVADADVATTRERMTRTIVEAYGRTSGEAARAGLVGRPERVAERVAAFVEAGAGRVVLSGSAPALVAEVGEQLRGL